MRARPAAVWEDPSVPPTADPSTEPEPIAFGDWVREYAPNPKAGEGGHVTYTVTGRPGKKTGEDQSKYSFKPARWAMSDPAAFNDATVVGADFAGVTFVAGVQAEKARFEGGASFRVRCVCA